MYLDFISIMFVFTVTVKGYIIIEPKLDKNDSNFLSIWNVIDSYMKNIEKHQSTDDEHNSKLNVQNYDGFVKYHGPQNSTTHRPVLTLLNPNSSFIPWNDLLSSEDNHDKSAERTLVEGSNKTLDDTTLNNLDSDRLGKFLMNNVGSEENSGDIIAESTEIGRTNESNVLKFEHFYKNSELVLIPISQSSDQPPLVVNISSSQTLTEAWKEYIDSDEDSGEISAELAEIERENLMKALSSDNVVKHYKQQTEPNKTSTYNPESLKNVRFDRVTTLLKKHLESLEDSMDDSAELSDIERHNQSGTYYIILVENHSSAEDSQFAEFIKAFIMNQRQNYSSQDSSY